jgi:phosphatidylinositol alpha-1,6-mannosyltransferase
VNSSARKPRVLLVTPDFPPAFGGIQRLMHRLARHFERVETRVVTLGGEGAAAFDRGEALSIVRTGSDRVIGHSAAVAALNVRAVAEALRYRPHVVLSGHIVTTPANLAISNVLRTPYAQYLHGREIVTRPRLTRAALRSAAAVIAVSSYTQRLALEYAIPAARVHRIAPGVDVTRLRPGPTRRSETPTIVTIARLEQRYKGHDVLIRALPLVRSRVPEARLVVIGDGPMRPVYQDLARSIGLDGSVEFVGALDDAARDRLLDRAHVFALTSTLPLDGGGEGFGMVYLEAAVHGLPAIAGDVGGAVDAVVHGETGLLVDPTDHVAVADALTTLLASRETAERLGRAGAVRAREFAWPTIARRVEDVLLEVAG